MAEGTAEAAPRWTRQRIALLVEAMLHTVLALVILFTATLHRFVYFDALTVAIGLFVISLAGIVLSGFPGNKWMVAERVNNVGFAAALLITAASLTPAVFSMLLLGWAALTGLLRVLALLAAANTRESDDFRTGKLATLLPVVLVCGVLLSGKDPIGVIGWFGAYATVWGVFGLIAAFDTAQPGVHTENNN